MKKNIIINALATTIILLLISLPAISSIIKENKRKTTIEEYAFTISTLTNKTKEMIDYIGYKKEVKCSNITTKEIVLNECTVNNTPKKYCYIDKFYDCNDENYKLAYQKALLAEIPKKYNEGDLVKITINNQTYDFYVLKDEENEITAISKIDLELLENTRLPNISDIFPNIEENWQEEYIKLKTEIETNNCQDCEEKLKKYQIPNYLKENTNGYKINTESENENTNTWYITSDGLMYSEDVIELNTRPVITISKDKIK